MRNQNHLENHRRKLYQNYYQNQAARSGDGVVEHKIKIDCIQLSKEVLPLLPIKKEIKLLDVGCGFGSLLKLLKDHGYKNILGLDISKEQVDKAQEMGIIEAKEGDIFEFLKDREEEYDVITGIDIIEHFSKDELVHLLSVIHKALKPSGLAIFRTPNMDAPFTSTFAYGDYTHQVFLNAGSAEQLMNACDFKDVNVFPSHIHVKGFAKESIRKILWFFVKLSVKLTLFASGKSTKHVLFTPNMIIVGKR